MSAGAPDRRLDALLRDLPAPPPVPADLAARVLAAAAGTAQEPRLARARRAAARDRRGGWLRRPLLAGTAALGLIVSSAVAATLAGVPIPQKLAAIFSPEEKAPAPKQAEPPRRAPVRTVSAPAAPVQMAEAAPPVEDALLEQPGPWRRLLRVQRAAEARRAMGLPTPGADRLERRLRRRAEMWEAATPEQRAQWLERRRAHREARQALLATPEGQAALAAQREQLWRWRAQRRARIPLTPEQRAERQALLRQWQAQGLTARPPLSEEQRAARQERVRRWQDGRRARWQGRAGDGAMSPETEMAAEGPDPTKR